MVIEKTSREAAVPPHRARISIDRGGTFTDCVAQVPGREDVVIKLLSVDPNNYEDAPIEGIRRILEIVSGKSIPRGQPLPTENIESVRMGTTVATNALLERKGERHAFVVTKGFKDVLTIGDQTRPKLFDLHIKRPTVLSEEILEVDERVTVEDFDENPRTYTIDKSDPNIFKGISGDYVRVLKKVETEAVRKGLENIFNQGYRTLAVCLTHSYTFPDHEFVIKEIAESIGFEHVSLSSQLMPMIKMSSRAASVTADAYLTPKIHKYIDGFKNGFADKLENTNTQIAFMQSDGGLVDFRKFSGLRAILSGPAGGVVGYALACRDQDESGNPTPVVGLDMGGTSTDVSRFDGKLDHVMETVTGGVTIQSPQLDINTIAAGGGSVLSWKHGLFNVGPESAGAYPGPACYRNGGPLTITDANLLVGRLLPEWFPKIFGPNEDLPLDTEIVKQKFSEMSTRIAKDTGRILSAEQTAVGFLNVANETMSRPIRALTEARGYITSDHMLASFGGAASQHAAFIAKILQIHKVAVHRYSSILSAYGMALADIVQERQEPTSEIFNSESCPRLEERAKYLRTKVKEDLLSQGVSEESIKWEVYLNMRYQGTDTKTMILRPNNGDFLTEFLHQHKREFSFTLANRDVLVDDVRVRGIGKSDINLSKNISSQLEEISLVKMDANSAANFNDVYFEDLGWLNVPVYAFDELGVGSIVNHPAIVIDKTQTIVVPPGSTCTTLPDHLVLHVGSPKSKVISTETVYPITLSIFGHRFMSIAEQMGRTLQKTSVSLIMKERLDFSCAIFGPDGGLVANAPHVPVHLGSMQYAVQYQMKYHRDEMKPGDVFASNHPLTGGTHLPDITLIKPVFDENGEISFFVAARGHHLDIGGLGGDSMPPRSTQLWQEGAMIKSFKIVSKGTIDIDGAIDLIGTKPGLYPGCSGSKRLNDNISDLKAQVAACEQGRNHVEALAAEFTLPVVQFYMNAIRENAEIAVRNYLKSKAGGKKSVKLHAVDHMDDGTPIALTVTIDGESGDAVFDFEGTGHQIFGNLNAPPSITRSATLYCMRALVDADIPMNQGCLSPITFNIPENTILNPTSDAAVCAGNTLTSQRLTDVVLKAFEACAASQGCMNCMGFFGGGKRDENNAPIDGYEYGYGETICGGSGAGPTWDGASAVQIHMTNTRTTDVEILEKRHPIIVREFGIRRGSGGTGFHYGGDGSRKVLECREPLSFSLVTERRVTQPYGMAGGENGARGVNTWVRHATKDRQQTKVNMGPKFTASLEVGDQMIIETPGGGGFGTPLTRRITNGFSSTKHYIDKGISYAYDAGSISARRAAAEAQ